MYKPSCYGLRQRIGRHFITIMLLKLFFYNKGCYAAWTIKQTLYCTHIYIETSVKNISPRRLYYFFCVYIYIYIYRHTHTHAHTHTHTRTHTHTQTHPQIHTNARTHTLTHVIRGSLKCILTVLTVDTSKTRHTLARVCIYAIVTRRSIQT